MGKLFLSHKSVNKNHVSWLKEQLTRFGHEPWYDADAMSAGDRLERSLLEGMQTSEGAVFFITDAYKDDKWIASEIDYAIAQTRSRPKFMILPIIYKERQKDPDPVVPALLVSFLAKTVTTKEAALIEILKRLGDEQNRQVAQSEIPPTPPRWPRLKRLLSRPALTHSLALLIGVALTAAVMLTTARKGNEPSVPPVPMEAPPDEAAITKEQRDKALKAFAEELDPEWLSTSFSMNKAETGKWVDICKIEVPTTGMFFMAAIEVTRDVRVGEGMIEKDRKDKGFVFINVYPGDLKRDDAKKGDVLKAPPAVVYGSLASHMNNTMHLWLEHRPKTSERHLHLMVTGIPAQSYDVSVKLYKLQRDLLNWFI
ncbi:toll/interleukin-1 receptor domain-containing protein [bacterium]|nr:toll/interleukin-1 receptor domain-containing protein [bacterium]